MPVRFYDKAGNVTILPANAGQPVCELLRLHGIPRNAVITTTDGRIVSEDVATLEGDAIVEIRQVRHYDLAVTRNPPRESTGSADAVYSKSVLFERAGQVEVRTEHLNDQAFVDYVEQTFGEAVAQHHLLAPEAKIAVGLSGGRDSVAFLKLLERTGTLAVSAQPLVVTVSGLPDWEEPETFRAALASCKALGFRHVIVTADQIAATFQLNRPFAEVMSTLVDGNDAGLVMVAAHHVMRRMIEVEAARAGADTIVLGLNADDLVATVVTWLMSGHYMGPIPKRHIGHFEYQYPLYRLTKKELTLYLEFVAPELNRQGQPGRFTTGPADRSLAYALTDHLYDLWPGADYYLFDALSRMQTYMTRPQESECGRCGAVVLALTQLDQQRAMCDVCAAFRRDYAPQPVA